MSTRWRQRSRPSPTPSTSFRGSRTNGATRSISTRSRDPMGAVPAASRGLACSTATSGLTCERPSPAPSSLRFCPSTTTASLPSTANSSAGSTPASARRERKYHFRHGRVTMYAITGITGKVGGELARRLLAAGALVRAVVRDEAKGAEWAARGCDVALAEMERSEELAAAFAGADGVFILPPSEFDPQPGYPEARTIIDAVTTAL